jgi:hypothetical protein
VAYGEPWATVELLYFQDDFFEDVTPIKLASPIINDGEGSAWFVRLPAPTRVGTEGVSAARCGKSEGDPIDLDSCTT